MSSEKKSSLQKLRKAAGYSTAKAFAEKLDIPVSTYARYEQSSDSIPLKAAWAIADLLDCSIDEVVGRTPSGCPHEDCEIRNRFDHLSYGDRQFILETFDFIEYRRKKREEEYLKREREKKLRRFNKYMERFIEANPDSGYEENTFDNYKERRQAFEEFVQAIMDESKEEDAEVYSELAYRLKNKKSLDDIDFGLVMMVKRRRLDEMEADQIDEEMDKVRRNNEAHLQRVVRDCMEVYDEMESDISF